MLPGSGGESNSRRESSMSNDSGYIMESRRTSDVDYFSNGPLNYNSSVVVPSSPTDWGVQQHPLITLHNYTSNRHRQEHTQGLYSLDMNSGSASDLSMQPIARRDSGMSTNSESSRRSSFFSSSVSPIPPGLTSGLSNNPKISTLSSGSTNFTSGGTNNLLYLGSVSSGCCSESSTDSLLEQDLQNLALSVSQKGLE